jgi:hypothetical protein
MLVWFTGWSAGTLCFDFAWVFTVYAQLQAANFPTAPGVITRSRLETRVDGDGDRHTYADLAYSYSLDGVDLTGEAIRFGMGMDVFDPKELVEEFPVGRVVDVFYDPREASRSALQVGLVPMDFFLPLFLIPFNIVMLGVGQWLFPLRRWLGRRPGNISVRELNTGYRYRIYRMTPLQCAALAAGVVAFLSTFVVGFSLIVWDATLLLIAAWIFVAVAAALGAYFAPSTVLEVDPFRDRIRLVQAGGEGEQEASLAKLKSIEPKAGGTSLAITISAGEGVQVWTAPTTTKYASAWLRDHLQAALGKPL